jgi:hypothetical protein
LARYLAVLFAAAVLSAGSAAAAPDPSAYAGLGTWIDVYDPNAWSAPDATAAAVRARGVRTLYLQTSNSNRSADLVRAAALGRLVDAAHARGLRVVAWYLPTLLHPARDLRRTLAAVRFRTPTGGRFDSFALDIESSSVRSPALRNARLLDLSRRLRAAVGPSYPLGAIIPSPVGMKLLPRYWPGFPYSDLWRVYDVFLPMAYFSYRAHGDAAVAGYVRRGIEIIRARTGDPDVPIHVIGGISQRTSAAEARGFMRAVRGCRTFGFSLYDFFGTSASAWRTLTTPAAPDDAAAVC